MLVSFWPFCVIQGFANHLFEDAQCVWCDHEASSIILFVFPVSLENVLLDVREFGKGMDLVRKESSHHDNSVLKSFVNTNEGKLDKLQKDARTAEVSTSQERSWTGLVLGLLEEGDFSASACS